MLKPLTKFVRTIFHGVEHGTSMGRITVVLVFCTQLIELNTSELNLSALGSIGPILKAIAPLEREFYALHIESTTNRTNVNTSISQRRVWFGVSAFSLRHITSFPRKC